MRGGASLRWRLGGVAPRSAHRVAICPDPHPSLIFTGTSEEWKLGRGMHIARRGVPWVGSGSGCPVPLGHLLPGPDLCPEIWPVMAVTPHRVGAGGVAWGGERREEAGRFCNVRAQNQISFREVFERTGNRRKQLSQMLTRHRLPSSCGYAGTRDSLPLPPSSQY